MLSCVNIMMVVRIVAVMMVVVMAMTMTMIVVRDIMMMMALTMRMNQSLVVRQLLTKLAMLHDCRFEFCRLITKLRSSNYCLRLLA